MEYIIVQAGGKGTRLGYLTKNKPKALLPVENLPMLFHLFRKYPDRRFIIIADYKKEVLREYLAAFAEVKYQVVDAEGTGTCAGIQQALALVPEGQPFMLIWSDLILPEGFMLPEGYRREGRQEQRHRPEVKQGEKADKQRRDGQSLKSDYIGISGTFPCRWSYQGGEFREEPSCQQGVAGFFLFTDKSRLKNVPINGELVRWMQQEKMQFREISLAGTKEFGLLEEYRKLEQAKCRPFNRISVEGDVLTKEPLDRQGRVLAQREYVWYEEAGSLLGQRTDRQDSTQQDKPENADLRDKIQQGSQKNIDRQDEAQPSRPANLERDGQAECQLYKAMLPRIYGNNPLRMEYVKGKNLYECELNYEGKRRVLGMLVSALRSLHDTRRVPADFFSLKEAYYRKTMDRLSKIEDLVPFARDREITVNGKKCRNVFFHKRELEKKLEGLACGSFCFIHGDCTFSNLMLREDGTPVLIDPRGYFGFTELYGDERYDWAKLYYSIAGNYDRFNLKEFRLNIIDQGVRLDIASNGWEDMEKDFYELTGAVEEEMKLLHAVIWLSLTTYAWQDYDSVCGAFYNGIYYLEDVL